MLFFVSAKPVKLDLGIVFGASGRDASATFALEKDLVKKILDKYVISKSATLLGAIVYDSDARIAIKFGDAMNVAESKDAIDRLQRTSSGNSLGKALEVARDRLFSEKYGARRNVAKTLVVFVDTKANDMPVDKLGGVAKDMIDAGVKIVVVAIGSEIDNKQVAAITSGSTTLFKPPTLDNVEDLVPSITEGAKPGKLKEDFCVCLSMHAKLFELFFQILKGH